MRQGFLAVAAAEPERVVVVDATRARDVVAAEIASIVDARLGIGEPDAHAVRIIR